MLGFLSALAKLLWPALEDTDEPERELGLIDVTCFLYAAPLAVAGLFWLGAVTDLAWLRVTWPMLLFFLVLLFLFGRVDFYYHLELAPGHYGSWEESLWSVVTWSAALILGPSALWPFVLWETVDRAGEWHRATTSSSRWRSGREYTLALARVLPASLIALTLYRRWGGTFPFAGLMGREVLSAFGATAVWWGIWVLLWGPFFWLASRAYRLMRTSPETIIRLLVIPIGWQALATPFAILAAALHAGNGFWGYLFFVSALLLASLLAHYLSRSAELSQQRSRALEKLEELSRAILGAPPDASTLPAVLRDHVPDMFPHSEIEVRIFPDQLLLRHPEDSAPVDASVWERLSSTPWGQHLASGTPLSWQDLGTESAAILAPILDVESTDCIGGIHILLTQGNGQDASLLPAVQSLASQIASALHGARVHARTLAHQRVEQELSLAGRIQARFLPEALPTVPGWQLAATIVPARETSGDFYDVIPLPNGRFGIVVADVADKGMGAALYMALSRTLLRTYAMEYHTRPDFVLGVTNRRILMDARVDMFVTVFYGILDPTSGTLTYANGGHNPPYLLSAESPRAITALTKTGMALGVLGGSDWGARRAQLTPGDLLVLYSDGVIEAQNEERELFGTECLLEAIRALHGCSAREVQDALLAQVDRHAGREPQFDDITLLVVRRDRQEDCGAPKVDPFTYDPS